jgi:PIN domain nuclease of toxin-antitoxin system
MRLLLDTHVLIALARRELSKFDARIGAAVLSAENAVFASAASTWEIAIKNRLGKLDPGLSVEELPGYFETIGLTLLAVDHRHAVRRLDPEPATKDPFDRLLLAQCSVEGLRLVTMDRALSAHPLSWRPA